MNQSEKTYHSGLTWPIFLIGVGTILLLNTLGWLSWGIWSVLLRLWPVLLIAGGVDLLIGRRSAIGRIVAALLIIAVLGGSVWFALRYPDRLGGEEQALAFPRDDIASAEVNIEMAVGDLQLETLSDAPDLLTGTVSLHRSEELEQRFTQDDERAELHLVASGSWYGPGVNFGPQYSWDLAVNENVSLDLRAGFAIGRARLALADATVETLETEMAIGETVLILPRTGDYTAIVDGAIGSVVILVPEGLGVRLHSDAGLVDVDIPEGYTNSDGVYESADYAEADHRVDLTVDMGIGSVEVRPYTP
jgi:hypothetical protein